MTTYALHEIAEILRQLTIKEFEERYGRLFLVRLLAYRAPLEAADAQPMTATLPSDQWEKPTPVFHTSYGRMSLWAYGLRFGGDKATLTVGRDPSAEVFFNYRSVSWRHASLGPLPEGLSITDLGSRNGTRINGNAAVAHQPMVAPLGASLAFSDVTCSLFDVRGLQKFAAQLTPPESARV